jgi:hypothetical protein
MRIIHDKLEIKFRKGNKEQVGNMLLRDFSMEYLFEPDSQEFLSVQPREISRWEGESYSHMGDWFLYEGGHDGELLATISFQEYPDVNILIIQCWRYPCHGPGFSNIIYAVNRIYEQMRILGFDIIEEDDQFENWSRHSVTKKGMTEWRKRRANLFNNIKGKDKSLTYEEVAIKATDQVKGDIDAKLREDHHEWKEEKIIAETVRIFQDEWANKSKQFSIDDVKNDFKIMGWKWEDARSYRFR